MMKNLLFIALAVFITSCSVDSIENQDLNNLIEPDTRSVASGASCSSTVLINQDGVVRGAIQTFIDYESGKLRIRYKTKHWKISDYKVFFGPVAKILKQEPDLIALGKYDLTESFENYYIADFSFEIEDVHANFCLMSRLTIKNGKDMETVFVDGIALPDSDITYLPEFVKECLK